MNAHAESLVPSSPCTISGDSERPPCSFDDQPDPPAIVLPGARSG